MFDSDQNPLRGYDKSHREENDLSTDDGAGRERCHCGAAITAISTCGPGRHVAHPCGHRVGLSTAQAVDAGQGIEDDARGRLRADGGNVDDSLLGRTTEDLGTPPRRLSNALDQANLACEKSDDPAVLDEISQALYHLENARDLATGAPAAQAAADGSGTIDEFQRLEAVDGLGPATIDTLREAFDSLDELVALCHDIPDGYSPARLSNLDGFGPSRARSVAVAIDESDLEPEAVTDGGVATASEEADLEDAVYYRVEGIGTDDIGEPFRDLANEIFSALQEYHGDAIESVIPVFNEEFDPRLGDSAPCCAATGCDQPMDHVVHGVLIDGQEYDVPTCGGHDGEGGDD